MFSISGDILQQALLGFILRKHSCVYMSLHESSKTGKIRLIEQMRIPPPPNKPHIATGRGRQNYAITNRTS
jgi:hypothetical protein